MIRAIAMLLATGLTFGAVQTPARDATVVALSGTASLAGTVTDADGHPLRRATVSIGGDMRLDRRMVTDDEGRFTFGSLPAGRFTVTAVKGGYPSMSYGARRSNRAGSGVLLAAGQQMTGIVLKLSRGGVLTGTVFDERGQPMPEVPVMAFEVRTSLAGERILDFPASGGGWVTTDDLGTYRIYDLPPGEYTVGTAWFYHGTLEAKQPTDAEIRAAFDAVTKPAPTATAGAFTAVALPAKNDARFNYSPVYYPDAVDPLGAATISVNAGEERTGVDIRMQLRPMSKIEGTVSGPDGAAGNATIVMMRRSPVTSLNSTTFFGNRPDGTFGTPNVTPGDYTILATTRPKPGETMLWALSDVTVAGAEPVNIALTLQPTFAFPGRIAFEGTTLEPPKDLSRVRAFFGAMQGTPTSNTIQTSPIDASGNFTISNVTPGRFRLLVTIPNTGAPGQAAWNVKSVVVDGVDLTDKPIEIAPGRTPSVSVTMTDQISELSGQLMVSAGDTASDYFIVALPPDREYWTPLSRRIASVRPDAAGRFVFRGLPAGEYRLAATTDLVPRDLQIAEALARLLTQSTPVTLGLGEKKTLDLKIGR